MNSRDDLVVFLDAPELGPTRPVGVLTRWPGTRSAITFTYAASWLAAKDQFAIDPRLPLTAGQQFAPENSIPSILADTSPDLWGQQLLERRAGHGLEPWEFLTGVADETRMGALRLRRGPAGAFIDDREPGVPPIADLRRLQAGAKAFEEDPDRPIDDPTIAMLIAPGSSLGGARPKANYRAPDGRLWIAKFPSRSDRLDIGAWELVFARLAKRAGIEVSGIDLLSLGGQGRTYVTRRFDRDAAGQRRLFGSAQTLADSPDRDRASYVDIAEAIQTHVAPRRINEDLAQMFRRLIFNVLAGNRDDHLRNHGFLRTQEGWRLAPAFDMNPSREQREHSISLDGQTRAPDLGAAMSTRGLFGLSETVAEEIEADVTQALANWQAEAKSAGISDMEQRLVAVSFAELERARRR